MQYLSSLRSLDLIVGDIEKETDQVINHLNSYLEFEEKNAEAKKQIGKAEQHLHRLKSVFTLLELPGCLLLTSNLLVIIKKVSAINSKFHPKLIEAIYTGTMRIIQYVRFIKHKKHDIPQLILPSVNELRDSFNASHLPESFFFSAQPTKKRQAYRTAVIISEQSASKSRYLRQMYHIGLIEVLRQTNVVGGLKMMQNAMEKLDKECQPPLCPDIWWLSSALIESFANKKLKLTLKRIKIFTQIDRQIKYLENNSQNHRQENRKEILHLANELLYLVSISDNKNQLADNVLAHFRVNHPVEITDELIRKELVFMHGPDDEDYASLSEALMSEIVEITEELKSFDVEQTSVANISEIKKKILNLSNLLKMIQVDEHTVRLSVATDLLEKFEEGEKVINHSDIDIIIRILDAIKSSISKENSLSYLNETFDRSQVISKEREHLRSETNKTIKGLILAFSEFIENGRRVLLLKNIPTLLKESREAFQLLGVSETNRIFDDCTKYVTLHLMNAPTRTSQESIDLFANIIGSLDFYLETLKYTATPNAKILEFAENSSFELRKLMKNPTRKRVSNF